MTDFNKSIETLKDLDVSKMYGEDFFLTWEKEDNFRGSYLHQIQ